MRNTLRSILPAIVAFGCGGTVGTRPHDESIAQHDRAARAHSAAATAQEEICYLQRRNELTVPAPNPSNPARVDSSSLPTAGPPCWKQADQRFVDAHRNAAARHRAASTALRAAAQAACVGIPSADRNGSPFAHVDDIASVEPIVDASATSPTHQTGVTVTFRAVAGMSADGLQRLVDCQLARNAAFGDVVSKLPDSPLVPGDVEAHVRSVGNSLAVEITSDDPGTAREILTRAHRLVAPTTTSAR